MPVVKKMVKLFKGWNRFKILPMNKSKINKNYVLIEGFKRYFKNTSWIFFEKIFRMFVQLIVGIYVIRYLGPEQFGILTYAYSFVMVFSILSNLGLENIIIRNLVRDKDLTFQILGTGFSLKLIGAVCSFIIIYIALLFTNNEKCTKQIVMIVSCWLIFDSFSVIDYFFRAQVQAKYSSIAQISMFSISSSLKIVYIIYKAPLVYFAYLIVFEYIILALILTYLYNCKKFSMRKWSLDINTALYLLKDSWPLMITGMLVTLYMKIDQIMIKEMLDAKSVGIYGASIRFSEVWYFIPIALHHSLLPAIVNAKKISEYLYYKRIQALVDLSVWIALCIALPITLLSGILIPALLGDVYQPVVKILTIQIWASIFVFPSISIGQWFIVENLQRIYLYRSLVGVFVNVLLNYLLIPIMGATGAAIATVITQLFASYISLCFFKNTIHVFWIATRSLNIFSSSKRIIRFLNELYIKEIK